MSNLDDELKLELHFDRAFTMLTINETRSIHKIYKDTQIIMVNDDCKDQKLHKLLFKEDNADVLIFDSVKKVLEFLDQHIPKIIIYETKSLDENFYPLIQRVRKILLRDGKTVSILVVSNNHDQNEPIEVEVISPNPLAIDPLVYEIWNLILPSEARHPIYHSETILEQNLGLTLCAFS